MFIESEDEAEFCFVLFGSIVLKQLITASVEQFWLHDYENIHRGMAPEAEP